MARDTFHHYVFLLVDIFAFRHNTVHHSSLFLLPFLMTLLPTHAHKHTRARTHTHTHTHKLSSSDKVSKSGNTR